MSGGAAFGPDAQAQVQEQAMIAEHLASLTARVAADEAARAAVALQGALALEDALAMLQPALDGDLGPVVQEIARLHLPVASYNGELECDGEPYDAGIVEWPCPTANVIVSALNS